VGGSASAMTEKIPPFESVPPAITEGSDDAQQQRRFLYQLDFAAA
jgi:hypothetical protein